MSTAAPNRTADPWPRWPATDLEWDILDWQVIKRCIALQRWVDAHPPRPFPAKVWVQRKQPRPVLRIDTSKLPVMPLAFWQEEQRITQERIAREWHEAMEQEAQAHLHAFAEAPFPTDTPTRRQRLSAWLDAHRGALKPWGRKKKKLEPTPIIEAGPDPIKWCTYCDRDAWSCDCPRPNHVYKTEEWVR